MGSFLWLIYVWICLLKTAVMILHFFLLRESRLLKAGVNSVSWCPQMTLNFVEEINDLIRLIIILALADEVVWRQHILIRCLFFTFRSQMIRFVMVWPFSPSSLFAACCSSSAGGSGCSPSRGRRRSWWQPVWRGWRPNCGTGTNSGRVTPAAGAAPHRVASQTPPKRQRCSVVPPAGRGELLTGVACWTCS